jgi:nucleotide-binding universal stress UspA family protein
MERTRWIVVGTDFSDGAAHALDRAVAVAVELGASLAVVHAFDEVGLARALEDPTSDFELELGECVAQSSAASRGVRVELLIRRGPPWDKLVNVATDLGAELIVVGAQGQRGAVHDLFLGSVATRVAAISTRAVLVVPGPRALPLHRSF